MAQPLSDPDYCSRETARILRESNTLLENDHFVYISGDHGSGWINKDALLPDTHKISQLAKLLAETVRNIGADMICGPAIGGVIMSQWLAHHLELPSVFAEHDTASAGAAERASRAMRPSFILKRGFDRLVARKRVLVVDDIINTGHSLKETAAAVRHVGGNVVAAAAYCSRGNADATTIGVPQLVFLTEVNIPAWPADGCHLCATNIPINVDYAHGRDFLEQQAHSGQRAKQAEQSSEVDSAGA